jgi:hypothetical protein
MVLFKDIVVRSVCPIASYGGDDWGREGWDQVNKIHDCLGVPLKDLVPEQFDLDIEGFTLRDKYDFKEKKMFKAADSEINISVKVTDPQLIKKLKRLSKKGFDVQLLISKRKEEKK